MNDSVILVAIVVPSVLMVTLGIVAIVSFSRKGN